MNLLDHAPLSMDEVVVEKAKNRKRQLFLAGLAIGGVAWIVFSLMSLDIVFPGSTKMRFVVGITCVVLGAIVIYCSNNRLERAAVEMEDLEAIDEKDMARLTEILETFGDGRATVAQWLRSGLTIRKRDLHVVERAYDVARSKWHQQDAYAKLKEAAFNSGDTND
jgi:hypothetical protein